MWIAWFGGNIKITVKYLQLLRVRHWTKNILIFFPAAFSGRIMEPYFLQRNILGFFIFSAVSSMIYIYNDLQDMDKDRKHPKKKERPLASGKVTVQTAYGLIFVIGISAGAFSLLCRIPVKYLIIYLGINIIYSRGGKDVPLLDVSILASGYILRLLFGGDLSGTGVSGWMFLTVMSAAFYLGFGKRRNELRRFGAGGRKCLDAYSDAFLDNSFQMFTVLTIVFYSLTCMDRETYVAKCGADFIWTVPIVMLICIRYNQLLDSETCDGDPVEVVLKDRFLIGMIIFYIMSCAALLYGC